ncbi:MAG: hypothetical protein JXA33_17435 [Anaerolineae bacterium]|nr:hypothetical protein [Anaerolineae bacterium]
MQGATFIEELFQDKLDKMSAQLLQQGMQQGLQQGKAEGRVEAQRMAILDVLMSHFTPPVAQYRRIESQLQTLVDMEQLRALLFTAVEATDITAFERALAQTIDTQEKP